MKAHVPNTTSQFYYVRIIFCRYHITSYINFDQLIIRYSHDSYKMERVKIAEEPDLMLLCEGTELLVCSQKLAAASPVFSAMFKPHFMEGHELRTAVEGALPIITLHEDSISSMVALCNAVHHSHTGDLEISPESVLAFAVAVDKYQCTQAITAVISILLGQLPADDLDPPDHRLDEDEPGPRALMTQAAYLLDSAEHFQEYTHALVLSGRWSYLGDQDLLPATLSNILSGKRRHTVHRLLQTLMVSTDKIIVREAAARNRVLQEVAQTCESIAYCLADRHEACGKTDDNGN